MPARTQELKIGIGFKKQTGTGLPGTTAAQLQTGLAAGDLWNLGLNQFNAPFPNFNQENDGAFFGKGDEWVENIFPTSIDAPFVMPYHLTSQNFAMAVAFAMGKLTPTTPASGAYQYVGTPMDPAVDGVNLPATTIVSGIRQGTAGEIIDMALIGCVLTGFTLRIQRGPGLQNTSLELRWLGCGKHTNNSGIAIPSRFAETRLGAGASSQILINDVDYLANARMVDVEIVYENGAGGESGYYPGSGSQSGYDIRGRMRIGQRSIAMNCAVELESDSTELAQLLAGTEGATSIAITGPLITGSTYHLAKVELPRTQHQALALADADGFTVARLQTQILKDATSGPMICTAITNQASIGAAA